jgi:potassium efflux system protein
MISRFLVTIGLSVVLLGLHAQTETEVKSDSIKSPVSIIPLNEITTSTETISERFVELQDVIKPSSEIRTIDTLLQATGEELMLAKEEVYQDSSEQTYRSLENSLKIWRGYEVNLRGIQERINKRSNEIHGVMDELNTHLRVWNLTRKEGIENNAGKEVINSIDLVIERIHGIMVITTGRSDTVFIVQKKLTEQALLIDEVIHEITMRQKNLQKSYFVLDSPPIWSQLNELSSPLELIKRVAKSFKSDLLVIWDFLKNQGDIILYQLILLAALLALMIYVRRRWGDQLKDSMEIEDQRTLILLRHPIAVVIAIGMLIGIFLYKNQPPVFSEFYVIVLLLTAVYLLPQMVVRRLRITLLCVFILVFVSILINYVGIRSIEGRLAQLFSFLLLGYALIEFRRNKKIRDHFMKKRVALVSLTLSLFTVLTWIGIGATLVGSVNLADFILSGVLYSTAFAAITWLTIEIISSLVHLVTRKDPGIPIQALSNFRLLLQKRFRPVLIFFGVIFWIYTTFISFGVIKYVVEVVSDFMEVTWVVGEVNISMGGIISFLLIVLVTLLLTRIIKNLLSEEWLEFTNVSKGSAGAISIILRIVVFTIGLYIAASAAGIDLSQLGFIVGALGVGIGFGLQSVVLNFIAGLILAFERPIHVGDTIEADGEMGVVSEIGIRASKIRKFSGAEVIIPNGDLIAKKVINYTLSDTRRRFKILFRTPMDADPKIVMQTLTEVAKANMKTLEDPLPVTYFAGHGDSSLEFFLYFWTEFSNGLSSQSEVITAAHEALAKHGIGVYVPVRKIEMTTTQSRIPEDGSSHDVH